MMRASHICILVYPNSLELSSSGVRRLFYTHFHCHHMGRNWSTLAKCLPLAASLAIAIHCPENNLNLRIKTEPLMDGADTTYIFVFFLHQTVQSVHLIYPSWLDFYAEVQINFGTVWAKDLSWPAWWPTVLQYDW